jgi:hypothetical protein
MGGPCSTNGEKRNAYRLLVGKPEGKRPVRGPRRMWVDNMRIDLVEIGWNDVDSICLAQDRDKWQAFVNEVMNLSLHKMLGNYRVASQLVASRVVLSSIELVSCFTNCTLQKYISVVNSWRNRPAWYISCMRR